MTEIAHSGIITAIKQNIITVEIAQKEACGSCALKDACSQTTKQHKIEVEAETPENYKTGQKVEVIISSKQAFYAALYGYIIPLFLVIFSLFLSFIYTKNETTSALCGLSILFPYYILLWIFRNNLKKSLIIKIR